MVMTNLYLEILINIIKIRVDRRNSEGKWFVADVENNEAFNG